MKLELLFKEVNEEPVKKRRNVTLSNRRLLNHSKGIDKDKYLILTNKDKYNINTLFFPMTTYSYPTYTKITLFAYQPKISLNFTVLKNVR